ncbi:hypothetical protein [Mycolicibacterium mengxianglii]|uniref:hypothetical protein n=1 Tax=Mycolicibacterium mengxianglii TaxID=2736649 RepID=UPI0018D1E48F|nr:hypothetical protein [Mycolicibacterium mengxianglii]
MLTRRQRVLGLTTGLRVALASLVVSAAALMQAAPASAEPVGPPPVPPIPNPTYGNNDPQSQFGYIGDVLGSFRADDPLGELTAAPGPVRGAPPGAGPSPPLPPGTVSLTAPESSTAPAEGIWLGPLPGMPAVPLAPAGPPA